MSKNYLSWKTIYFHSRLTKTTFASRARTSGICNSNKSRCDLLLKIENDVKQKKCYKDLFEK